MMLVKADSVFSPEEGYLQGKVLLIRDGVLEGIVDAEGVCDPVEALDFRGYTIAPPFCDHHLHFSQEALSDLGRVSQALISHGIREAWDGGDRSLSGVKARKALQDTLTIRSPGFALYKGGGYGKQIGRGVANTADARRYIEDLGGHGVDYIKIVNSGIFKPETGEITAGGFEPDELKQIVSFAREKGLSVAVHANGDRAIRDAVQAGACMIIHGFYVSEETLQEMGERGVRFIPTVAALHGLMRVTDDSDGKRRIGDVVEQHLMMVKFAHDAGVKVFPGSDSGPAFMPHGSSYMEELGFLQEAGIGDHEIIASAVSGPFREGARADFLVLKGLGVEKVFLAGRPLGRQS